MKGDILRINGSRSTLAGLHLNIMPSVLTVVLSFVLTGLIGNWLVQRWQTRHWLAQQRFLGEEKEYTALKELVEEISRLLGVRIFQMQRLNRSLNFAADQDIEARVSEYSSAVKEWNERLTSFYVRLPILAAEGLAIQLEEGIQDRMVQVSTALERMVARRRAKETVSPKEIGKRESELNEIQGRAIAFNKRLVNLVSTRRTEVYFGRKVPFTQGTLGEFSTWQLVVALFVRQVRPLSVFGASRNS